MRRARVLAGRVVVVTGVTAGIGRASAARLARAGATVVGCARDAERLALVADRVPGLEVLACDVRDGEQREALVDTVLRRHGRIDVLVNNAGVGYVGSVVDMTNDDVERVVATNLTAVIDLTRRVLPGMLACGEGDVLMVSSSAAWVSTPPLTLYASSKRGVDAFVEGLRREVAGGGVRVHSVNPFFVATEFPARAIGVRPREDDPEVRRSPGISADRVALLVRAELERGRGRTVAAPRWAGAARLASYPVGSVVADLVVRPLSGRFARAGRELAEDLTGSYSARS